MHTSPRLARPSCAAPIAGRLACHCRKTLRRYLACLSDASITCEANHQQGEAGQPPPLDILQAAAAHLATPPAGGKAWEGSGKLAR